MNSRGFGPNREPLLFDHGKNFDFCLIQETLCADNAITGLSSRWRGPTFWSPAIGKQGGVAVLVNENFQGKILSWRKDIDGRIVSLLIDIDNFKVNLLSIYAPTNPTTRKAFFENLHAFFLPADATIIGGDFNCYEHDLDKFGGNVSIAGYLAEFRSTFLFTDIWQKLNPRSCQMSRFNSNHTIGARLDKFFVSRNIASMTTLCEIVPCVFSDHDFVHLHVRFTQDFQRGPGLWKFRVHSFGRIRIRISDPRSLVSVLFLSFCVCPCLVCGFLIWAWEGLIFFGTYVIVLCGGFLFWVWEGLVFLVCGGFSFWDWEV